MYVKTSSLLQPAIPGHENLNLPAYAYLINHQSSGTRLLFDAGPRKDWWNYPPHTLASIENILPGIQVEKNIVEILSEGGISPASVAQVIISHWHWDHIGDMSLFPKTTDVIVGPGFKAAFEPYYPKRPSAPMYGHEFEGRSVQELNFDSATLKVGPYVAIDHFKDGSLFLLNIPGHAVGHIGALVRTTIDSFIFLAGDVTHFTGALRPSRFIPMPPDLPRQDAFDRLAGSSQPRELFTCCHPDPPRGHHTPYYHPSTARDSWYIYPDQAQDSIDKAAMLDAQPNILTLIAHDPSLRVLPKFPHGDLNEWMDRGWKQMIFWAFVDELPVDQRPVRPPITDGLYRDGVKLRDWKDIAASS